METYSTAKEINSFIQRLGPNPLVVNDCDANAFRALTKTGPAKIRGNATHDIPYKTSLQTIDELVARGEFTEEIFARKPGDARLFSVLADLANRQIEAGDSFSTAYLTARGAPDVLRIFKQSGVTKPIRVTMGTDSGNSLFINGKMSVVYKVSTEEESFFGNIKTMLPSLKRIVQSVVSDRGLDPGLCPDLLLEESKSVARNVHYRTVLDAYGETYGSTLDIAIGHALKNELQSKIDSGPKDDQNIPVFKTLDGPATVEVIVSKVNKGLGLRAIMAASKATGNLPSSLVVTGDDVSKGNGRPGTDYYMMIGARQIEQEYGIPVFNVHTHFPTGMDINGTVPDPGKSVLALLPEYPAPRIDLRLPTPRDTAALINQIARSSVKSNFGRRPKISHSGLRSRPS